MRIAIDCRYVRERPSGIGVYVERWSRVFRRWPRSAFPAVTHRKAARPLSSAPNMEEVIVASAPHSFRGTDARATRPPLTGGGGGRRQTLTRCQPDSRIRRARPGAELGSRFRAAAGFRHTLVRCVGCTADIVTQTVILAAGMGTRLGSAEAGVPKPLMSIGGMPLVGYALAQAEAAGCTEAVVVIGYEGGRVRRAVEPSTAR